MSLRQYSVVSLTVATNLHLGRAGVIQRRHSAGAKFHHAYSAACAGAMAAPAQPDAISVVHVLQVIHTPMPTAGSQPGLTVAFGGGQRFMKETNSGEPIHRDDTTRIGACQDVIPYRTELCLNINRVAAASAILPRATLYGYLIFRLFFFLISLPPFSPFFNFLYNSS